MSSPDEDLSSNSMDESSQDLSGSGSFSASGSFSGSDDDMDLGDEDEASGFSEELEMAEDTRFEYKVLTAEDIMAEPLRLIEKVNEVLQVHPMVARQLLEHFQWSEENAVQQWYTADRAKLLAEIKLPAELKSVADLPDEVECSICLDDCPRSAIDALPCGHIFCLDDWDAYLTSKVLSEGKAQITCPAQGCHLALDELSVTRLLRNKEAKAMHQLLSAKAFVRRKRGIRWCPAPDCKLAISAPVTMPEEVECKCGHKCCFACGHFYHRPASCADVHQWIEKRSTFGENALFLAKSTKNCPNCKTLIFKDAGCQYVRCTTCSTTFCWLCLKLVDHKNHECSKWKGEGADDERSQWNRYAHYYERYKAHAESAKFEAKLMAKAEATIQVLTTKGITWIDAQYIKKATEYLREARKILSVSYIMGYYLPKGQHEELFENFQGFLEEATERLSQLLEQTDETEDPINSRLQVINLSESLRMRLDNFCNAVEDDAFRAAAGYTADKKDYSVEVEYSGWVYNAGN